MTKSDIQVFFDKFSANYNRVAFDESLGLDYLNKIETNFITEATPRLPIQRLLEIGFGTGRNLKLFKGKGIKMYGVDISKNMIRETQKVFRDEEIELRHFNAEDGLPYQSRFFDLILCIRVLKYMPKWPKVLAEISRCLKKNGYAIIEVPNLFSIHLFGLPWANYFLFFIPNFFAEVKRNRFEVVKIRKGAILPHWLYQKTNNATALKILSAFDNVSNWWLPVGLVSRNYLFLLRKK